MNISLTYCVLKHYDYEINSFTWIRAAAAGICLLKCFCLCFCWTFRANPDPKIPWKSKLIGEDRERNRKITVKRNTPNQNQIRFIFFYRFIILIFFSAYRGQCKKWDGKYRETGGHYFTHPGSRNCVSITNSCNCYLDTK